MATQDNVSVFRRIIDDLFMNKNPEAFEELLSPDFVDHEGVPGVPPTREGVKQLIAAVHAAFPDFQVDIEQVVAQDDLVVFMTTWRGTQSGPFMGIPPTGKQVAWKVYDTVRIVDGKCVEHWGLMDQLSLMQQLGVIPTSEAAS
jgi:steroid delta-isomerase-like uncharacterized protein